MPERKAHLRLFIAPPADGSNSRKRASSSGWSPTRHPSKLRARQRVHVHVRMSAEITGTELKRSVDALNLEPTLVSRGMPSLTGFPQEGVLFAERLDDEAPQHVDCSHLGARRLGL